MEQSVTTGRRGLRLRRSKPTRSRIAELTRRASQKTDWEEGRCERKLPSTLSLPKSARTVDLGMELRMSERSEHYDIHSEFQVPRMVNRSCGRGFGGETPDAQPSCAVARNS